MSFHWADYLTLAQELTSLSAGSSIREAYLRSAISRAYYTAFLEARDYLVETVGEKVPSDRNVHQYVADTFERSRDTRHRRVGGYLRHLRLIRNRADYSSRIPGDLFAITRDALLEAKRISNLLRAL
jgi:uncharacterized protein (UPF0332 family)